MSVSPVSPQLQAAIEEEALKLSKGIALGDCNIMLQAPNPIRSSNKLPWFMDRIDQLTAENQKLKAEAEQTIKLTNGASVSFVSNPKNEKLRSLSDDWATLKQQALLQQNTPLVNEEIKQQVDAFTEQCNLVAANLDKIDVIRLQSFGVMDRSFLEPIVYHKDAVEVLRSLSNNKTLAKAFYWLSMEEKKNWIDNVYLTNTEGDPDGLLTPLPSPKPVPRTITAPQHDFIGALYKPYEPPV